MKLWNKLYGTVWLAFFACVFISRWMGPYIGTSVHVIFGVLLLIATLSNARSLAVLPEVPARLKRISKVTAGFAIFQVIGGLALGAIAYFAPNLPVIPMVLHGVHVVCALAILAQASSVATAYDMWEEKEFGSGPSQ
jgi:hypothetical protein